MRPTFMDFLDDTERATTYRASTPKGGDMGKKSRGVDLSKVDCEAIAKRIIDDAIRKARETAVDERERLMADYLQAHPADTRVNAVDAVYRANKGLYERCRREETVDRHGRRLSEIYDRASASFGVDQQGRPVTKGAGRVHTAQQEVDIKTGMVMQKSGGSLTYAEAVHVVFREDRAAGGDLYERYRRESQ